MSSFAQSPSQKLHTQKVRIQRGSSSRLSQRGALTSPMTRMAIASGWSGHPRSARCSLLQDTQKPTPKPRMPNFCTVKETPNMGLGLFATADIGPDELLFSERPLIVYPMAMPSTLSESNQYLQLDFMKISLHEQEQNLECAVSRMSDDDQKAYRNLWNNHTEDGSGPLLGIARTNGYVIDLHDGLVETTTNSYCAVGKLASRINHSCLPNVYQQFEIPSFSIQYKARRYIKAGEQILYSYCRLDQTLAERRLELAPYGMVCTCSVCVNAMPETDKLRKEYAHGFAAIRDLLNRNTSNIKMVDRFVEEIIKLQQAMLKEGLDIVDGYVDLMDLLESAYSRVGTKLNVTEIHGIPVTVTAIHRPC